MDVLNDNAIGPLPHIYRAQVVDNKDPENVGRVKVIIPALSGTNVQVWARPISAFGYSPTCGSHVVPDVGCYVYVMFENGDVRFPVYMGGVVLLQQVMAESQEEGSQEKEYVIMRTPNGNVLRISDNKNKFTLRTANKRLLEIDDSQQRIYLKTEKHSIDVNDSTGEVHIECDGKVMVHSTGETRVKADGKIFLDGGSGDLFGVINKKCKCIVVGAPHLDASTNVSATKGG
jgi:uncharacterized protein involved in type VI secretion and phage assembly